MPIAEAELVSIRKGVNVIPPLISNFKVQREKVRGPHSLEDTRTGGLVEPALSGEPVRLRTSNLPWGSDTAKNGVGNMTN